VASNICQALDDGKLVWQSMFDYVGAYLKLYYKTQADVDEDKELSAWWKDVTDRGFPAGPDCLLMMYQCARTYARMSSHWLFAHSVPVCTNILPHVHKMIVCLWCTSVPVHLVQTRRIVEGCDRLRPAGTAICPDSLQILYRCTPVVAGGDRQVVSVWALPLVLTTCS